MNEVQICNAALSYLGCVGNIVRIDPPDGSPYSETCSIYYPQALRYLTEQHNWAFATKRLALPSVANFDQELYQWNFGYTLPSDLAAIVGVYSRGADIKDGSEDFQLETQDNNTYILLTNTENPILRYVAYITDTGSFPAYFTQALILQTASYLSGPLMKTSLADKMVQLAAQALEIAKYKDNKNSIRIKREYEAPHLKARSI